MSQTLGESIYEALGKHNAKLIYFDYNQTQRLKAVDDPDSLRRFLVATRLQNADVADDFDQTVRNIATVIKDRVARKNVRFATVFFNPLMGLCVAINNWLKRRKETREDS